MPGLKSCTKCKKQDNPEIVKRAARYLETDGKDI